MEQITDRIGFFYLHDKQDGKLTWAPVQFNYDTFLTRYQKETKCDAKEEITLQAGDTLRLQAHDLEFTPDDHIIFYFE